MKLLFTVCFALCLNSIVFTKTIVRRDVNNVVHSCKSVEFDNGNVEFNHFVSNQMRAQLCAQKIHNYNATGRTPMKFLGEEYNYNSHQNPCQVVCRYDPMHESIADQTVVVVPEEHVQENYEEVVVENVVHPLSYGEYKSLAFAEFHLAENVKCGELHTCDAFGCCVKSEHIVEEPKEPVEPVDPHVPEEPKEPVEPHEPHVPEEPKEPVEPHEPVDPHQPEEPKEPVEPHEPVDPHEPHTPEDPIVVEPEPEPVQEKEYACSEAGVFADSEDETAFFRCYLKSAHVKCAEGLLFDKEQNQCLKPLPEEPDFEKMVSCSAEGFFRNPYDCKRFYRCYYNTETERQEGNLRIGFFQCRDDMVFDNTAHTCVLASTTAKCENLMVPHEPEDVKEDKEPEYQKILKCETEGYFRNPYECHRFYRCYRNHHSESALNLALYVCGHGKVFDEVSKNCVPHERTAECVNRQIPVEQH